MAGKLVGFLMLPVLVRTLPVGEFGRLDLLSTLVSALVSALLLGFDTAALRLYFDLDAQSQRNRLLATWLTLATLIVLPAVTVMIVAREELNRWLLNSQGNGADIVLVGAGTALGTLLFLSLTVARMARRPVSFAVTMAVNLLVTAGATVAAFLSGHRSVTAVLAAMVVGNVAAVAICPSVRILFGSRPSRDLARRLVRLGLPLAPGVVAMWAAEFAHRAILAKSAGVGQVAYFSVAARFGSLGVLLANSFQLAWLQEAYDRGSRANGSSRTAVEAGRIVAVVCVATVAIALVSPELLLLLGGVRYLPALGAVGFAELLGVVLALTQVASIPSALGRRFGAMGVATLVASATSVGANLLLAHRFGATGAAAAVTGGAGAGAMLLVLLGRRGVRLPIPWPKLVVNVTVAVVVVLASCLPSGGAPPVARLGLGLLAAAVFWAEGTPQDVLRWAASRRRRGSSPKT